MQNPKSALALVVASLALGACVSVSNQEINERAESAAKNNVGVIEKSWVVEQPVSTQSVPWIKTFEDPILEKLVAEALTNNRDLQAAAANVDSARALAVQAGALLKPTVTVGVSASRGGSVDTSSNTANSFLGGFLVRWEADIWGNIRSGAQAAVASAESEAANFRFAQYSVAAYTIKAYVTAIDAKLQRNIVEEQETILVETLRIVNIQVENGLANSQDLALAKSDLASTKEQLITAKAAQRDATRALELLLGRYPSAELAVRETLPHVPDPVPAGIPSELLERRPDLIAAERLVAAAFNTVQAAKTARLPVLSLSASLGGSSPSLSEIVDPVNVLWQLGSNLIAPIYSGGALQAEVEIATADQEAALAAYGQAALTAFREVERALDQNAIILEREKYLVDAQKESEEAYRIAKLRYESGETDLLDLLSVQARVISTKSNLASVRRLAIEQRVDLNLALGGKFE